MVRPAPIDASAWLATVDPVPVIAWLDGPAIGTGFDPASVYVETTGALAIFKSPECLLAATRVPVR